MNLKRSVLAATAALSLALGAAPLTPAANATDVTPAQVAAVQLSARSRRGMSTRIRRWWFPPRSPRTGSNRSTTKVS